MTDALKKLIRLIEVGELSGEPEDQHLAQDEIGEQSSASSEMPARAWLLAVIRAKLADDQ